MLILSNNIASYNRIESLMQQIRSRNIPCISLEQDVPDFHFIGTNNYAAMAELVEHLITVHDCRTFNFVGGFCDHIENKELRKAFIDVLTGHAIPVEQDRIRDYCFSRESGEQAFRDFMRGGSPYRMRWSAPMTIWRSDISRWRNGSGIRCPMT